MNNLVKPPPKKKHTLSETKWKHIWSLHFPTLVDTDTFQIPVDTLAETNIAPENREMSSFIFQTIGLC